MTRLAICYPTVNHAEAVEQVICYSIEYLYNNGVDVYYYDSSDDDKTEELIRILNQKGYDNVYHIKLPAGLSYGEKIDYIFSGYGLAKEYDYIWPLKDRVVCNEALLKIVLEGCEGRPDALVNLTLGDAFEKGFIDISSPEELYINFAKQITSIGVIVYATNTLLKDYKFGKASGSAKYQNDFWHYWFLFNKLPELKDVKIRVVSQPGAVAMESSVAVTSFWQSRFLEVWIEEWIQLNYELPEIYSPYKLQVIKDTTSIRELLGDPSTFEKLHDNKILTKEVFIKYKDMWDYVTNIPVSEIERIAYGPEG